MNESDLLNTMNTLNDVASALKTTVYIWGGLAQDIYEGRFLREHSDIDCLMLNRNTIQEELEKTFIQKGWSVVDVNGVLSIKKDGSKIHLGNIEPLNDGLLKYTFFGGFAFIAFPKTWLKQKAVRFCGLNVLTTEPEFEYAMRAHSRKKDPTKEVREKDKIAMKFFEEKLRLKRKNLDEVLAEMRFPLELISGLVPLSSTQSDHAKSC